MFGPQLWKKILSYFLIAYIQNTRLPIAELSLRSRSEMYAMRRLWQRPESAGLFELLDRMLDKGIVIRLADRMVLTTLELNPQRRLVLDSIQLVCKYAA